MSPSLSLDVMRFFPPDYTPRNEQRDAILKIQRQFESGKRIVAFQGPTGMGKTLIAQTFALMTKAAGGRTHYLTIQKALQDQLVKQFPEIVALKGRANYECTHEDALGENADKGVCRVKGKGILAECVDLENRPETLADATNLLLPAHCHKCPYWRQAQLASEAVIAAFTFSSFLFQQRLGRFGAREFMVIDECHNIENELMRFVTLELTEKALAPLRLELDKDINSQEELLRWIEETDIHDRLVRLLGVAAYRSEDVAEGLTLEQTDALKSLLTKIQYFRSLLERTDWVVETRIEPDKRGRRRRKVVGRPLFVRDFAKDLLFSNGRNVLCMSATILDFPIWARNLGLDAREVGYVDGPCTFPAKNRPIHLTYAGSMGRKYFEEGGNPTRPKLMVKIREILGLHRDQRGIIHCHSKKMAKAILEDVRSPRFLHQEDFENEDKTKVLAAHALKPDSVIVAPAMHEGVDLHDGLGRFQILAKVPWPGMDDKLIAERKARDERFYTWLCALKLIQSMGRIVRHAEDWGYTYVLDSNFAAFLNRNENREMIPDWILDAVRRGMPTTAPARP